MVFAPVSSARYSREREMASCKIIAMMGERMPIRMSPMMLPERRSRSLLPASAE